MVRTVSKSWKEALLKLLKVSSLSGVARNFLKVGTSYTDQSIMKRWMHVLMGATKYKVTLKAITNTITAFSCSISAGSNTPVF